MTTITVNTSVNLSLDESAGLQNLTATPTPLEDANDTDILVSALPPVFSSRLAALVPVGTTPSGAALSGYTGAAGNTGSNIISVTPTPGGAITDLGLVGPDGAPLNGLDSGLDTLTGVNILLYTDTNNNIVLGRAGAADGPVVFAIYLEETGGTPPGAKMWSVQYTPLKNPDATNPDDSLNLLDKVFVSASEDLNFSLANAPSGNNLFVMFGDTNVAIVVTGKSPADQSGGASITTGDTVVTSQGGGTTTIGVNNQMFDPPTASKAGEGAYFTFVTGANSGFTVPNLSPTEANVEGNIQFNDVFGAQAATFTVSQLQPANKAATLKISAKTTAAEPGVNFVNGLGDADDQPVAIDQVRVYNASGALIEESDGSPNDPNVSITFNSGTATISGLKTNYRVEYHTTADSSRVLIENVGSSSPNLNSSFDIGGFKLLQVSSTKVEIGSKVLFEDDGPSISTTGTEPTLTVDETVLATNDTKSFAANFTSAFGVDGAGTLVFALGISASETDSGLVDTATGNHVFLFVNAAGVVEGREGTDAAAAAGGAIVFTVSAAVNGDVTLDQLRAVAHPDVTNPDDSKSLTADTLVTLTGTITDKDGDRQSASLNIGSNLVFKDDGPSISTTGTEPALTVDETVLATNDTKNFAANFTSAFGADGAGTLAYALGISPSETDSGLVDTATGNHVFLFVNAAGVVEGREGTDAAAAAGGAIVFTVSAAANGDVMLDQLRAVVHPDATTPDDSKSLSADNLVTLTGTITDKDGDSRSATLNIGSNLLFKDDGPAVSANATVKLDDDALAGGNAGGTGDDINAENVSGTLGHTFGADGGSIAYLTTGAPAGFTYQKSGDDLLVRQGTTTVLTLTLNAATGAYTVTQNAPIVHAAGADENNQAFSINYQVTDRDGDKADGTLSVNVDDDTPTLDFGNLVGTGTILPQYGEWNGSAGADKPGNLDLALNQFQLVRPDGTTIAGSGFAFAEQAGSPNAAGDYLFAGSLTADFDNKASTADTTNNFTLTAFHDGKYAFDLAQPFGSTITFSSANGSLGAGGPDPVQTLTIPPDEQVVFFGVDPLAPDNVPPPPSIVSAIGVGEPDLTEAQIQAAGFSFIGSAAMNVSTAGIGIGNNNLDGNTTAGINAGDESFVVNPETLLTRMKVFIDNSVGGYDPASEELYYKIFFDDGTNSGNVKVVSGDLTAAAGGQKSFVIDTEGSKLIDSVQLTMGKGTIKVPVIEFIQATENLASDVKLDFTASLTDADSDTATSNFSVDLFANDLPANSYTLLGASSDLDSFDVDLAASQVSYRVEGFDTPDDTLFLLGDSSAGVSINNSGTDSIVTVSETLGSTPQTTIITVVAVDLLSSNIVLV